MATYSKGSLRERSKGHWQARFCRTDRSGSSIVTRSFEATSRRAATLIMEDIRRELIEQDGDGASSRELIAYMLDYVDERERSQQIEASTATNYRSSIKHLARYLGGYSVEEITPENVMDVQAALLADGLVADTVAKDHRFFKQVMDYACEMGHIHRSPFNKATKPPKRRKPRPNALDERSRSMLLSVLDASPTTKQSVAARLGLLAGLRREEVAGLRWGDVDLVANRIRVGRAVGVSNGRPYLKGTKTEAGERATRELRELARCIVPSALKGQPFFTDNARNLFVGIALRIIMDEGVPEESKTVMSVAAAISPSGQESALDRIASLVSGLPPGHPSLPFLSGINGESGGAPGVISTLATYLSEYADGNVALMLHGDECALDRIGEEPTVFFVSSSSATGNYKRLVQTFVAQTLSALRLCAARNAGRCPVETVLVLDEAASLGRNERLIQDLGEMRSEGVHVLWFCQSLLQLQSVSGYSREEAETILDLLKDKVVLSCSNVETARKLSESLGSYTALSESRSRTKGANSGSTGTSEGTVRRPLITPDELMRWTGRETGALVIHDGHALALPSRDVSETFVAEMLGMTSSEAEKHMMEEALSRREIRNETAPPVWTGVDGEIQAPRDGARVGYTPEGF